MNKLQVYVDMDGVLADFDRKVQELYGAPKATEAIWTDIEEKHPRWFDDLHAMPDMGTLLDGLDTLTNMEWIILSALPNPKRWITYEALTGKTDWVASHIGNVPCIFCLRSHKQDYATSTSVLIDDREENIQEWVKKGGIGILHKNAKASIEELKSIVDTRGRKEP